MKKTFELDFRGRKLVVETGELAKQAHGAVLVRYGDTVILSTAVVSKNANILSDFFPLMVLYQEKLYSVGKIPGGFIKREGRPTDAATLAARMIDRPMRPMFPEEFRNEVQVVNTVLSVDNDYSPELTAMFGSSLSTSISKIPFDGPIAGVKVGRVNGEFIINPTPSQLEESDIDLIVAGTKNAINMVEAGSKEVTEEDMLEALMFGHEAVKELCIFQEQIIKEVGQEKMEYEKLEIEDNLKEEIKLEDAFNFYKEDEKRKFIIVLVHDGKTIRFLDESTYEVDLVLGGHSLNGSIVIPYYGGIFIDDGAYKYYQEHYSKGITDIYISSGVGTNKYPYRIFNKPSFNLYRLKAQS